MGKHSYPANRKNRDVSYSKSYKLLQAIGEEKLKEMFSKAGMYTVSKQASLILGYYVSPAIARHCRSRYNLGEVYEKDNF